MSDETEADESAVSAFASESEPRRDSLDELFGDQAVAESPSAATSQGWGPSAAGEVAGPDEDRWAGTRYRDRLLWLWPLVLITAMAVLGEFLGAFGVLLAGTATIGVLVLFIGVDFLHRRTLLAVLAVTCAAITVVWFAHSSGFLGVNTASSAGSTQRFKTTTGALSLNDLKEAKARGVTFTGVVLDGLDLSNVKLEGVVVHGGSMRAVDLEHAHLSGADLQGADLTGARLQEADLRGAILTGANLTGADLTRACLRGADLSGAVLTGAVFRDAAIADVKASPAARNDAVSWPSTDTLPCF